jgi:hypothetical protein
MSLKGISKVTGQSLNVGKRQCLAHFYNCDVGKRNHLSVGDAPGPGFQLGRAKVDDRKAEKRERQRLMAKRKLGAGPLRRGQQRSRPVTVGLT